MSFTNPFVLPTEEYRRDIDVFRHYLNDQARFLSIMTGDDYETCRHFVMGEMRKKNTEFGIKDPTVTYFERLDNGDREQRRTHLSSYLNSSIRNEELIAPTLTVYQNPRVRESMLVNYVDSNIKKRGVAKKQMFAAEMAKDMFTYRIKKIEQTNAKLSNNAMSGAHVSSSTPLYNKTSHSTLTSTCRSTSGYGNANNEKMLSGNRHYWSPDITRNNIISLVNHTNYKQLKRIMLKYGIRPPTVEETMDCIKYSTQLYWRSAADMRQIQRIIGHLSDLERAAFVYTGDLYHLMKYNNDVVYTLIKKLSTFVQEPHPEPEKIFEIAPDDYRFLAIQICASLTKGIEFKKLKLAENGEYRYAVVAANAQNIMQTVMDYEDFIKTFFVTTNLPASVAHFPDSIRRAALTSDTDSTIFTVQDWVEWYFGYVKFGNEGNAVAATMIFLASQAITHVLAQMSANFGIEKARLHQIAMKNEFKFDVFTPTQVAKHYFAIIGCQEGNLFEKYKMEIKGVHLKSSNAPKAIMKQAQDLMKRISYTVVAGEKISILAVLKEVADVERNVIESVSHGSTDYFRLTQINRQDSYKEGPDRSPYLHYLFWNEVFGPKYGMVEPPPYTAIKISVDLPNPSAINEWLATLEDRALADRFANWFRKTGRKNFKTFYVPDSVATRGVPKEILDIVGVRKIVLDVSAVFYIILETLGIYMLNKRSTRLVSDTY